MSSQVVDARCPTCGAALRLLPAGDSYRCDYCARVFQRAADAASAAAPLEERVSTPELEAKAAQAESLISDLERELAEYLDKYRGSTHPVVTTMVDTVSGKVRERIQHTRDAIAARDLDALEADVEKLKLQRMLLSQPPPIP